MRFVWLTLLGALLSSAQDGWQPAAARTEIRPEFRYLPTGGSHGQPLMLIHADHRAGLDGCWRKIFDVQGGRYHRFHAMYRTEGVADPRRSVVVEIVWRDAMGHPAPRELGSTEEDEPMPGQTAGGRTEISQIYRAPERATHATVELRLRWAPNGTVTWPDVSLAASEAPAPRIVRLAALHLRPKPGRKASEELESAAPLIAEAGRRRADLVVLGEYFTSMQYSDPTVAADPVPGPSTDFLGALAKRHNLYIVAGLTEREGSLIYNTAILVGPDGKLQGKYRKICLTAGEARNGITPGDAYPVFETRFGKLGIMICYDLFFPEISRELSNRGAEIVAVPLWGGDEDVAKVRARDNRVYLVASTYMNPADAWMKSGIWDPEGNLLAAGEDWGTAVVAEVDLNQRHDHKWLGDFKSHVFRARPSSPAGST